MLHRLVEEVPSHILTKDFLGGNLRGSQGEEDPMVPASQALEGLAEAIAVSG